MDFLDELNDEQRRAATIIDGAILILAGAGSGKTKTITSRLAYLLCQGIPYDNTLTLTFTNKAAKEMRQRAASLIDSIGLDIPLPRLFTFHKFGLVFLKEHIHLLQRQNNFSIIDTDDKKRILKQFIDKDTISINLAQKEISHFKIHLISPQEALKYASSYFGEQKKTATKIAIAYEKYEQYILSNNLVDFDDLIKLPYEILHTHESLQEALSNQYKYIMIDEFQDTNELQFLLIKKLCKTHNNLCVVGDDDQSIYSWRGANVQNILGFENNFKDVQTINLTKNYRSTQKILDLANMIISFNKNRFAKTLLATQESGEDIVQKSFFDERIESDFVGKEMQRLISLGQDPSQIAVLYRINALSRSIEESLLAKGVPFNIVDGLRFYERMEVKDALSYLRLIINTKDDFSLKRIINKPKRGIGAVTIDKIQAGANEQGLSLFDFLNTHDLQSVTSKKNAQALKEFVSNILFLQEHLDEDIDLFINHFEEKIAIRKYYALSKEEERAYNIDELYAAIADSLSQRGISLEDFLNDISLESTQDNIITDAVNLMSVHASKGLEFEYVFIIGLEEGFFPLSSDDIDAEEERRLMYVACTRAKKKLYLHTVENRFFRGVRKKSHPSKFLKEAGLVKGSLGIAKNTMFKKGELVKHKIFGMGRIVQVTQMAKDYKLQINFGGNTREIMSSFVEKI